jgi:acetyltransferase AlgX (SGNH hydrolase-like protein)
MNHDVRLIAAFGLAWGALLGVSLDVHSPQFRPSDVLRDPSGPRFRASQDVVQERIGDLAYKSLLPEFVDRREIRFRTDDHGFRNPRFEELPRVVVLGDSFAIGVSLDEPDTLTARMTERLGEPVYNHACYADQTVLSLLEDPRFEQTPPSVVVLAPAARRAGNLRFEAASEQRSWWADASGLAWLVRLPGEVMRVKRPLDRDNGLTHLARAAYATVRYRVSGEISWGRVLTVEGERKLVLKATEQQLRDSPERRRLAQTVEGIVGLRDRLAAHGGVLLFTQIPEPGLVYEDLYENDPPLPRPLYHDLLFDALAERGVECLNLLPVFEGQRFPYLFLRADTHWNPRGVDIAAEALSERVGPLLR